MSRDTRKASAYDSGMRGKEKPNSGDSSRSQKPGGKVGNPAGEAYSSGMRGGEQPRQKSGDAATDSTNDHGAAGGENARRPGAVIGNPEGEAAAAGRHSSSSMTPGAANGKAAAAHQADASTEASAQGMQPSFEEDDTHVNIRVPKSSFKRSKGQ
jgi:hypothetical protein